MQKKHFQDFHQISEPGGIDFLSTFDPELRNEGFALISFMGYPAILSTLQPLQICIYKRKYSKLTFLNGSQVMGKGLWHISMHHWTVHAKVEFPRFPPDVRTRKGRSIIFHHVQDKSEMKNFRWQPGQSGRGCQSSFNFWSGTQKCKFCIDIFYGVILQY